MKNTLRFIKENWINILLLGIAWGGIVAGLGAMYGFSATAVPFAVGLGCGAGCGALIGFLTLYVLDPNNEHQGMNTLWDLINIGFYKLEANGTRPILLNVAITIALWACGIIPTPMGVIFGVFMGNLVIMRIGFINSQNNDPVLEELAEDPVKRAAILKRLEEGHDALVSNTQTLLNETQKKVVELERMITTLSGGKQHEFSRLTSPSLPRPSMGGNASMLLSPAPNDNK